MGKQKLRPGERQILEALSAAEKDSNKKGLSFTQIKDQSNLSRPVISDYLKRLWKDGLILRDIYTRRYRITVNGIQVLTRETILEKMDEVIQSSINADINIFNRIREDLGKATPKASIIESDIESLGKFMATKEIPIDVVLWLNEDKDKMDTVFKRAEPSLKNIASRFVEGLKEAVIDAYGARYKWDGWEKGPLEMRNLVLQERRGLDFEATLLLHFNGKELAKEVNWEKEQEKVEYGDRLMREGWHQFIEDVNKPSRSRECWIVDEMVEKFFRLRTEQEKFIAKVFDEIEERMEKDDWDFPRSPQELEELFINLIASPNPKAEADMLAEMDKELGREAIIHPLRPSIEEAKDILKKLQGEGVVEIVPFFFFKIDREKASKKFWEAKAGYRSPTRLFVTEAFGLPSNGEAEKSLTRASNSSH